MPLAPGMKCAVGKSHLHTMGEGGGFYLSNIDFGIVLKCQTKKTSIIQGNEPEVDVSQLPGGQATDERQVHFIFSPAKQLLSFSWCQVLLSHLTHQFDCPENEQNNEPLAQGSLRLPAPGALGKHSTWAVEN